MALVAQIAAPISGCAPLKPVDMPWRTPAETTVETPETAATETHDSWLADLVHLDWWTDDTHNCPLWCKGAVIGIVVFAGGLQWGWWFKEDSNADYHGSRCVPTMAKLC